MIANQPARRSRGWPILLLATFACASADATPVVAVEAPVATSMESSDALPSHFQSWWPLYPAKVAPTLLPQPARASSEAEPAGGACFRYMAPGTAWAANATTLQGLLCNEESGGMPQEPVWALAHKAHQAMAHGLLADLDTALRALQESGDDPPFLALREAGPVTDLRLAQRARSRANLY